LRHVGVAHYASCHKVAVYSGLQKFAATIEKGDLVAMSGPIYGWPFAGKNERGRFRVRKYNSLIL
jgi:hypothetical protein